MSKVERIRQFRFSVLLAVLLVHILIAPGLYSGFGSAQHPYAGGVVGAVGLVTILLTVLLLVTHRTSTRLWALSMALPGLAFNALNLAWPSKWSTIASFVLMASFFFYLIAVLLHQVFSTRRVTADLISASLCAYLVIALMWSSIYGLIEVLEPGSFRVPTGGLPADGLNDFVRIGSESREAMVRIYFSFVTLTTLGYGDVVPVSSVARLSAVIEAFVGQVFLVVLVARMVGVHVAQASWEDVGPDS